MIYILFAIAAFMSIVTAFILNNMAEKTNPSKLKITSIIIISIVLFIIIAAYLLQQKSFI